jgi:uncharacterized damage-inducible protein DinB
VTQLFRTLGMLVIAVSVTAIASAQTVSIQAEMLKDWTDLKATMGKIAGAMPEDKFTFKSTPPQRDFGQQVMHVATVNARFLQMVGGKGAAPKIDPMTTGKAATIAAMDQSFDYGIAVLKELNDQTILQPAAMPPAFLGPSTRARMFTFLIGHTWDIYGQMAVYLRLNGVVPPASVRP